MTGISFGSLYDLICIVRPGSLGKEIESGLPNYAECVTYSLSILGGTDGGYPNVTNSSGTSVFSKLCGAIYS